MVTARLEHEPVYHLYGSPGTVVMKGNSFIQADLNLVLYVAGPWASLAWEGKAAGAHYRHQSPLSQCRPFLIQSHSFQLFKNTHELKCGADMGIRSRMREHKTLNFRLKTILKFKVLLVDQLSRP